MPSMNKVFLMGNLGTDPELKRTPNGSVICSMRMATQEKYKGKDGKLVEDVQWHRITTWGVTAENCAKYLKKGSGLLVEGVLKTRSYEKNGIKHYVTEVSALTVTFMNKDGQGRKGADAEQADELPVDDDAPF